MQWLLGSLFALGVVLMASHWLWPELPVRRERKPSRLHDRVRDRMAQAGLSHVPTVAVVLVSTLLGLVAGGLALLFTGILAVIPVAVCAGASLPILGIGWRARAQRRARAAVWPEVIDHLVAGVRSGLAIPETLASIAENCPESVRRPFAAFAVDYRATGSFNYSLDRLKDALADPVADRLLETLRMGREVGGSEIGAVLRQLGSYLRAEQATRGELVARQSWIVYAARLGLIAPWLVLIALSFRPEAAAAYNTPGGLIIILVGGAVTFIAYRVMLSIARLPEEGRFFA